MFRFFKDLLYSPKKVFASCMIVLFFSLILDGSLYQWWNLNKEHKAMQQRIEKYQNDLQELELRVEQAKQPLYLKRQAKERFDLVEEDEIVFYFVKNPSP